MDYLADSTQQCRNVCLNTLPKDIEVQCEIGVSDDVAHSRNFAPWDVRIFFAKFTRELFDRFADDVKVVENAVNAHGIAEYLVLTQISCVFDDAAAAFLDVSEKVDRVTQH